MTHISGHERSQRLLLPESLDEYVGPDNPVRFIDAFVDGLDLAAPGFVRVMAKATGRPGYLPRGSPEAVYLRLPEPGAVEPTARGGDASQYRGDLAAAASAPGFQDDCRFPARQQQSIPPNLPPICAALPPVGSVWPGTAGSGWHPDQGGQ